MGFGKDIMRLARGGAATPPPGGRSRAMPAGEPRLPPGPVYSRGLGNGNVRPGDVCPHCGIAVPNLNEHTMDRSKVHLLAAVRRLNDAGRPWLWCPDGRELFVAKVRSGGYPTVGDARALAGRLYWGFGLLDKYSRRETCYRVSDRGRDFLEGQLSVPAMVWCQQDRDGNGSVVRESDGEVFVGDVRGVVLDKAYWDDYAAGLNREPPPGDADEDEGGDDGEEG